MRSTMYLLATVVALVAGCASAAGSAEDGPRRARDFISTEELQEMTGQGYTALDAVQRLRPHFLRVNSVTRPDPIIVYVDGIRRGGTGELSLIRVDQVASIRYVRGQDAQTRYGLDHGSGAIEVSMIE